MTTHFLFDYTTLINFVSLSVSYLNIWINTNLHFVTALGEIKQRSDVENQFIDIKNSILFIVT